MPILVRKETDTTTRRIRNLESLLSLFAPIPTDWPKLGKRQTADDTPGLGCFACDNFAELRAAWEVALKWTEGLNRGLAVMLASVASTKSVGDQLWIKLVSPASSAKTRLAEALGVARQYVVLKDTIRGFTSGYKLEDGTTADLLSELDGMTFITTDGDTLLQSMNLPNILAEGRRAYDGSLRSHFKNNTGKTVDGHRMTWILCGTASLNAIDSSELGERFLTCVMMDHIDDVLEDEILWKVANRAEEELSILSDGKPESHREPKLTHAMQLTGGYVEYLRENANALLQTITMSDKVKHVCTRLGKFVSYMRARPSKHQDERAEREFAARLVIQHVRLAKCLAVVLNRSEVDKDVMEYTSQVAMDTARGPTLDICRSLYKAPAGLTSASIELSPSRGMEKSRTMLRFLRQIGAIEKFTPRVNGANQKERYRLTDKFRKLYVEVMQADEHAPVADDVPF